MVCVSVRLCVRIEELQQVSSTHVFDGDTLNLPLYIPGSVLQGGYFAWRGGVCRITKPSLRLAHSHQNNNHKQHSNNQLQ